MTAVSWRARRAVALLSAAALVLTLSLVAVDRTSAAYTDRAAAMVRVDATGRTSFGPQETWLAGTTAAIQEDGSIAVWGFRGNGLSGTGVATVPSASTISMTTLPSDGHPDGRRKAVRLAGVSLDNVDAVAVAFSGMAALSDDGRVYTWGGNQANNVMGRSNAEVPFTQPGQVEIPGKVVDLTSSFGVFMALTSTGDLYTWGFPQGRGITGQGTATASSPVPTRILDGVHSIGAGAWNGWAIRGNAVEDDPQSGVLWWGWSNPPAAMAGAPSGDGGTTVFSVSVPTRSQTLSQYATDGCEAVGVVAGSDEDHCGIQMLTGHYFGSQAILRDGSMLAWGNPIEFSSGGPVVPAEAAVPTPVAMPEGVDVVNVARSQDYVMLHGSDQLVYAYGRYSYGGGVAPETGAVSLVNLRTPTVMTALGPVVSVSAFGYSGQALRADGTIVLWGGSTFGQNNNPYQVVRNTFETTTMPNLRQPLTTLVMPGTEVGSQ